MSCEVLNTLPSRGGLRSNVEFVNGSVLRSDTQGRISCWTLQQNSLWSCQLVSRKPMSQATRQSSVSEKERKSMTAAKGKKKKSLGSYLKSKRAWLGGVRDADAPPAARAARAGTSDPRPRPPNPPGVPMFWHMPFVPSYDQMGDREKEYCKVAALDQTAQEPQEQRTPRANMKGF